MLIPVLALFFVFVEHAEAVASEVAPAVVGCTVTVQRQGDLLLVEKHFEENIFVLRVSTVEDELQIRTHGEDAGAPPPLFFQLVEMGGTQVETVSSRTVTSLFQ